MSMSPRRLPIAVLALLSLTAGACRQQQETPTRRETRPSITLKINSPATGTSVKGNVVSLDVAVTGVQVKAADGDTSGRTGHFHVFIDEDPVRVGETIPRQAGIVHSAEQPVRLYGLSKGRHRLAVVMGDGTHRRIGEALAETEVTVDGPVVDATAPANVAAGQPVSLEVKVEGVQLVAAAQDTSGRAGTNGHLHVFVGREPFPPGQPIPAAPQAIHTASTKIDVPAASLQPGENTIWVVLGYSDHVPFDPPVMDRVTVTVGGSPSPGATGSPAGSPSPTRS